MVKSVLKHLLPPVIIDAYRSAKGALTRYHSLDQLDRKIEKYLDKDGGYFVELGANDGVCFSNTLYFERRRNWRGVLIEPVPHNYLKCRANRSSENHVFCNACVSFDYKETFVEIAFSNLMSSPMGLESDIADPLKHASSGRQFLQPSEEVFTFGARAKTLNDILLAAKAPQTIDLLSLDVEGAEIEVLKGINHEMFRFSYIVIECRSIDAMTEYLSTAGYRLVEKLSGHDYIFEDSRGFSRIKSIPPKDN